MGTYKNNQVNNSQLPQADAFEELKKEEGTTVIPTIKNFAELTSLHAIPFINSYTGLVSRVAWITILIVFTLLFGLHFGYLSWMFSRFETTSNVEVVFEKVVFPSITFCNLNPVRTSQLEAYGSERLRTFLTAIEPDQTYGSYTKNDTKKRRKRQTEEEEHEDEYEYNNYQDQDDFFAPSASISWDNYLDIADDYDSVLSDTTTTDFTKTKIVFKELLADLPQINKTNLGHRLSDMMLSCTYDGVACNAKDFVRYWDIEMGNCWTFNSAQNSDPVKTSARSGSFFGLDMILYIEEDEYISGLQLGRGVRVDVHAYETMPFVLEGGLSVAPGQQAYVSMQMLNQTRLGGVYGNCNDSGDFVTYYGNKYRYTLEGCLNTCEDRTIASECKCIRRTKIGYYNDADIKSLHSCRSEEELACVEEKTNSFKDGSLDCGCHQACSTTDFQTVLSFDKWPDDGLWHPLVESVCVRDTVSCDALQDAESSRETVLQKNFMHLKFFYQNLNVHRITENPAYEWIQFGSDLGGTVGLWLGASLITIVEVVDLCIRLCHYCYKKEHYKAGRKENGF